jgi:hypothetical protein
MKDIRFKGRVHWASTYQEVISAIKKFAEGDKTSESFRSKFKKAAMV